MRLSSTDGTTIELTPIRYEFDRVEAGAGAGDWDANWLVIDGTIRLGDGRTWAFSNPSLTTFEARRLTDWLQAVCADRVTPAATVAEAIADQSEAEGRLCAFLEPNLAFSLAAQAGGRVRLRVHLSLEALPPWLSDPDGPGRPGLFDYTVDVDTTTAALAQAAEDWATSLADFPIR